MLKLVKILFPLALAIVVAGVNVAAADAGVTDAAEIKQLMKEEPGEVMVLDVRTSGEYARGHIQGSLHVPMRKVPDNLSRIPKEKKIVVVCATGARSEAVANFLAKKGYPWVKNYRGGMVDWGRRGNPIAR